MNAPVRSPVLVVASGLTEQEAVPLLLRNSAVLAVEHELDVRIPPNHQALSPPMAARLIKAGYWSANPRPEKVVVLVDCDGSPRAETLKDMERLLRPLIVDLIDRGLSLLIAGSRWHLESWFFADPQRLREALGRDLGNVDLSDPDAIPNPKQCLVNLLGSTDRLYTARVAGDLARTVNPDTVKSRSQSFAAFQAGAENGHK